MHCRSTVFARRSMQTANWLKHHTELPLIDPYDQPWNINGVLRLTGIRLPNGKYRNKCIIHDDSYVVLLCRRKYRGHTTRSELYGYRNGNKIEALELCMVPAGEEHTIGPRLVKYTKYS